MQTKYDRCRIRQVTINVNNPPPPQQPPAIRQFSASSNQIPRGQCVTFDWRTDNAQGVNLLRNGGAVVAGGWQRFPPRIVRTPGLSEYKLVAYGVGPRPSRARR
ncbi:MAG: hypothetical protein IPK16_30420 [Anaerolineales bacterium]|nr:hypothetical protein [Anaerolineales bacterium]